MVAESWFRILWRIPRKHRDGSEKVVIGALVFEVASSMSNLIHLWQSLSDTQIVRLREGIMNSVGIRKLVSDDDDSIVDLIRAEMIENMAHVARLVARLGKKCNDPGLKRFEHVFDDLFKFGVDPYGWEFSWKKMERKVKKMERLISATANLYQEMVLLVELEQTLKRMKDNNDPDSVGLLEVQKKIAWTQHKVKHLQGTSLWSRTYDYTIHLFARSLFTIFSRIKYIFGINQTGDVGEISDSEVRNSDYIHGSYSVSALMLSSVHRSENNSCLSSDAGYSRIIDESRDTSYLSSDGFNSGILDENRDTSYLTSDGFHSEILDESRDTSCLSSDGFNSGILDENRDTSYLTSDGFHSEILDESRDASCLSSDGFNSGILDENRDTSYLTSDGFHSEILDESRDTSCLSSDGFNFGILDESRDASYLSSDGFNSEILVESRDTSYLSSNGVHSGILDETRETSSEELAHGNRRQTDLSIFTFKYRFSNAPPETLGAAALALHYANVIIVIEKLVASPHLIGHDARDVLYNMLPASVRAALRARQKPYTKSLASSIYDPDLAAEWIDTMAGVLGWLAPLAHNMIRWQSERSFERQKFGSRTNVLLVQTLYFANQEKTEVAITELLVGLNYIWRLGREVNARALLECASSKIFDEYLDLCG